MLVIILNNEGYLDKQRMKRIGNLYYKIYDVENLKLADRRARRNKGYQSTIKEFDKEKDLNLFNLSISLKEKKYKTSKYTTFIVKEPKERVIYRLPYFPDRITHHAVVLILESIFVSVFTADTYSCIKKRGIHKASKKLTEALQTNEGTKYCLKIDIKKFYPSIDNSILKKLLRKKFKDKDLLWLLDEIIDSIDGVPIGNYLSQYFANFYLTYFDHWIKKEKKVKFYFRYADDMVFLSDSKEYLYKLLSEIKEYLWVNLRLVLKENHRIFPVIINGIDFVGYVHFPTHKKLRKKKKKRFAKMLKKYRNKRSISSYKSWAKHCNSRNLIKKLFREKV